MIDDTHLNEIASSLEHAAADAKTQLTRCNPPLFVRVTANRAGFLRLAASCLRAAAAPMRDSDCRSAPVELVAPHQQVCEGDSDLLVAFLQRMETWPEPDEFINARSQSAAKKAWGALLTYGVMSFVLLALLITGIATIAGWVR